MDAGICDIYKFQAKQHPNYNFYYFNYSVVWYELQSYHWNHSGTNMELTEISEGSWNVVGAITDDYGNFFCHIK